MTKQNLYLLPVSGTFHEMGAGHGDAARKNNVLHTQKFYSDFMFNLLMFRIQSKIKRSLRSGILKIIQNTVEKNLISKIPNHSKEQMEGFSSTSGIPFQELARGYVMPDVYSYLLGKKYGAFHLGCTSFLWKGEGRFLHARNLDYVGGQNWNQSPAVIEYHPKTGHRYAAITSLGIDSAGITAMNEAGLSLSLHLNYSTRVTCKAVPTVTIGHEVIRLARTIDQAIEILKKSFRSGGWSWLLSSSEEKEAAIIQFDRSEIFVQRMTGDSIALSNHFLSPNLQKHEFWISEKRKSDSLQRKHRAEELLKMNHPSVEKAIEILGDSFSPELGREYPFGGTICQVHATTSVVMDPLNRQVFVATGESPISKRKYTSVQLFPLNQKETKEIVVHAWTKKDDARAAYAKAYDHYFPSYNISQVEDNLLRAIELDPAEKFYQSMLEIFYSEVRLKRKNFFIDFTLGETVAI